MRGRIRTDFGDGAGRTFTPGRQNFETANSKIFFPLRFSSITCNSRRFSPITVSLINSFLDQCRRKTSNENMCGPIGEERNVSGSKLVNWASQLNLKIAITRGNPEVTTIFFHLILVTLTRQHFAHVLRIVTPVRTKSF